MVHKAVAMTADSASNMGIAAKTLQIVKWRYILNPAAQRSYTKRTISWMRRRLVSPIQYLTKIQIWSQVMVLSKVLKRVFAEHYDVRVKVEL